MVARFSLARDSRPLYVSNFAMSIITPAAYDSKIEGNVIFTKLDAAINWMRKNSLWPMPMGLACCAIELMATASQPLRHFAASARR